MAKSSIAVGESWALIVRLFRESLSRHLPALVVSFLCLAVIAGMTSAYTYLMGPFVDHVLVAREGALLLGLGGAVVAIFVARSLARYAQEVLLTAVGQRIVLNMQERLFEKVVGQSLAFFDKIATGDLVGRFTYDVNLIRTTISRLFLVVGKDCMTVFAMIMLMFSVDWKLAALCIAGVPISLIPIHYLGRKLRQVSLDTQAENGRFSAMLMEAFEGVSTLRSYRQENLATAAVARKARALETLQLQTTRLQATILPVFDGLGGLAVAGFVVYGGSQVIGGFTTPGNFVVFVGAVYGAYQPLRSLARVRVELETGLAAVQRVFALMDHGDVVVEAKGAVALPRVAGEVSLEGVTFSYGQEAVLQDLTLTAPAQSVTALVGRSGAGKSTVLNLISRFYDPDQGTVRIDGMNVGDVTFASLR
ncbi:MAG TPA: ABC transporter ATP-binding protein, partial [Caulobacter sp.]|nr:ABC transporter ATP-binding protein [Caulobacter sp.]